MAQQTPTAVDKTCLLGAHELVAVKVHTGRSGEHLSVRVTTVIATLEYISKCFKETIISPVAPVALVTSNHCEHRAVSMLCSITI